MLRTYRLPILGAAVSLGLLAAWMVSERHQAVELGLQEVRQAAHDVADTVEASIQAQVRRGHLARERVHAIFDSIVHTTDVAFLILEVDGRREITSGNARATLGVEGSHGTRLDGPLFLHWEEVRLEESPLPLRHRYPDFDWQDDGVQPSDDLDVEGRTQVLILGTDAGPYYRHVGTATNRLLLTGGIGLACIIALTAAWSESIRNRLLAAHLDAERLRGEHLAELGQAAAGLAHETKNPLGLIRGLAQRVSGDVDVPPRAREMAESILDEVDTAVARLGDFLAYASTRRPHLQSFDGAELVRRVATLLEPEYEAAGLTLEVSAADIRLLADVEMLKQVLVNLLLNSLHASTPGSTVRVLLTPEARGARMAVRDEGCGIPPEVRPSLFRPYVTGRGGGHGLGLAIVGRIAEQHGWTVEVRSPVADGRGTEVTLEGLALGQMGDTA